jgi:hypothetical protein
MFRHGGFGSSVETSGDAGNGTGRRCCRPDSTRKPAPRRVRRSRRWHVRHVTTCNEACDRPPQMRIGAPSTSAAHSVADHGCRNPGGRRRAKERDSQK